jgi:3-methyladenine DNA glycosylase Mpg
MASPDACSFARSNRWPALETMQRRRPSAHTLRDLTSGPGRLTLALGITRAQNGADVTRGALTVRTPRDRGAV